MQLQLSQLTELESHLANLGAAIPDLSQTTGYLEALSISNRPVQVRRQPVPSCLPGACCVKVTCLQKRGVSGSPC